MLKRSSAAMAAANNTLEQNIALGVAGNEIVQTAHQSVVTKQCADYKNSYIG